MMTKKQKLTEEIVKSYLKDTYNQRCILSWEGLKMNLETGVNRNKIDYTFAQKVADHKAGK